ncbi:MAG TPA: DUF3090 family protein, partial [Marmoricola sp.]|nr:DUF3090 family protein [Marmoricola sp.]
MAIVHRFDPPQRFVAGTVGVPGQRAFYLQARSPQSVVSLLCEKQQVHLLAERIGELLDDLIQMGTTRDPVPALTPVGLLDSDPLETPIDEQFRAGTITLSWDPEDERIVIEIFPVDDADAGEEQSYDEMVLIRLPAASARAFAN